MPTVFPQLSKTGASLRQQSFQPLKQAQKENSAKLEATLLTMLGKKDASTGLAWALGHTNRTKLQTPEAMASTTQANPSGFLLGPALQQQHPATSGSRVPGAEACKHRAMLLHRARLPHLEAPIQEFDTLKLSCGYGSQTQPRLHSNVLAWIVWRVCGGKLHVLNMACSPRVECKKLCALSKRKRLVAPQTSLL